jgi:DNA (cytosine-5)-methyltransferase 1
MNVIDLFSGIGGFSVGLERAGMRTIAFCEIDPFARAVLKKHWPHTPIYHDVRNLHAADFAEPIDVICGGFPCQGISTAGQHKGLADERSGLWSEFARLIGELRPRYAIVENVGSLTRNGLGRVLGDLAEIGFDAEWDRVPACAVGARHRRDRTWIVAYPEGSGGRPLSCGVGEGTDAWLRSQESQGHFFGWSGEFARLLVGRGTNRRGTPWEVEPSVARLADGVRHQLDRNRVTGLAVVPQVVELIGRAIMKASALSSTDGGAPHG